MDLWDERDRPSAADLLDGVRDRLHAGDVDGFARRLEIFYSGLAGQNLDSEACFRAVLQTLCRLITDNVQAEKSTWGGRSDLEVAVGEHIHVMEVKRDDSATAALHQIQDLSLRTRTPAWQPPRPGLPTERGPRRALGMLTPTPPVLQSCTRPGKSSAGTRTLPSPQPSEVAADSTPSCTVSPRVRRKPGGHRPRAAVSVR